MSSIQLHNKPTAIVIFGGTGNLAQTKLLPALFHLYIQKLLPTAYTIIGLSRQKFNHADYQTFVSKSILAKYPDAEAQVVAQFCLQVRFSSGSFDDSSSYQHIAEELTEFDASIGQCTNKLFYLAVPPDLYAGMFDKLQASSLMSLCDGIDSWSRLLVEKPFGSDLATAQTLERQLCSLFAEEQIYRIDHYLAKEAIENIMSLRFANSVLSDSWNGSKIESINVRLLETKDVSTRGAFYDGIGTLRDVGQNHILQILALLTMKPADVHSAEAVRKNRLEAIESLVMHDTDSRVRGQYTGYLQTPGVHPDSTTETYFKIETHIDSATWQDVQVTLESGKALHDSFAEAVISFRPLDTCTCAAEPEVHNHRNVLRIRFSPERSICLSMWVKEPGLEFKLHERTLVLTQETGEALYSPEAYERVLYDCIVGDQTRFVSGAEVTAAWKFITPILESFAGLELYEYEQGSHGPISK